MSQNALILHSKDDDNTNYSGCETAVSIAIYLELKNTMFKHNPIFILPMQGGFFEKTAAPPRSLCGSFFCVL